MREIRFRAWIPDAEEIVDVIEIVFTDGKLVGAILNMENEEVVEYIDGYPRSETSPYWEEPDFVLMQYTGLEDKNGKSIYEGDICVYAGDRCGVVTYDRGKYIIISTRSGLKYDIHISDSLTEVIGNVHENPELLGE